MSRSLASWLACAALIGLTLLTWRLAEGGASVWLLGAVSLLKIALIAAVFLELLRSWPGWIPIALALVGGVLGGAAWFIASAAGS